MLTPCRLIVDPPLAGPRNMAVDEFLLEAASADGVASLRFYEWAEPTLSLGYFQPYSERASHPASRDAAVVRRISGGGALVHDCELTYCLCLPTEHELTRQAAAVYARVHTALIEALAELGVSARLHSSTGRRDAAGAEPFLCFERRTSFDVVATAGANGHAKIAGSAQRRRRGALLQHGAVLSACSPRAPTLRGVHEIGGSPLDVGALVARWTQRVEQSLQLKSFEHDNWTAAESARIAGLERRHGSDVWIKRR